MDKIVVASMRQDAGKTSIIAGMALAGGGKIGYMKPFGDRMLYRKKEALDYDAVLMSSLLRLEDNPEDICLGFDHSKLRYMHRNIRERLLAAVEAVGTGKDRLFIEGGRDLMCGTYVHLGSLSLAKHTGAKLMVVVAGNNDAVVDDMAFLQKYLNSSSLKFAGVVINKVHDTKAFKKQQLKEIIDLGVKVLGIIPYEPSLTYLQLGHLSKALSAKLITGEAGLTESVKDILIGAMSVDAALQKILSEHSEKLLITAGDRSDMILAALESDTKGILLTNGILPPANIISKAESRGVPMMLVGYDTFTTARLVNDITPLLMPDSEGKLALLSRMVMENINIGAI